MVKVIMHGCQRLYGSGHYRPDPGKSRHGRSWRASILWTAETTGIRYIPRIRDCQVEADVIIDFASAKATDALLAYGREEDSHGPVYDRADGGAACRGGRGEPGGGGSKVPPNTLWE